MKTRAAVVLLALTACPPPGASTTDAPETSTSTSSASTSTTGATDPTTSTTSTSTTESPPDLPPPCPVGSLSCPCTQGGSCDPGLACEAGTCSEACAVGSLGCACTNGGGCDSGLTCDDADVCVDDPMLSPPCMAGNQDDCCGDNVLDEFEDCDLGPNGLDDAGECTTLCKFAACGDGFVQTNVEACDGGDNCTPVCTFTTCGDGKVDPWEWCEPRGDGDPECTSLCLDARKVIFVTSEHYVGGEIGGVEGGDTKCQATADSVALPGEFKSWLATSHDDSPLLRFNWLEGPYVDVNGQQIAATWLEVYNTFGSLPPHVTELGSMTTPSQILWPWMFPAPTYVVGWASTLDGYPFSEENPGNCGGWADTSAMGSVALMDQEHEYPNQANKAFVVNWNAADCSLSAPIICVEQ